MQNGNGGSKSSTSEVAGWVWAVGSGLEGTCRAPTAL